MKKSTLSYITGSLIGILMASVIIMHKKNLGSSNALLAIAAYIKSFFLHSNITNSLEYKMNLFNRAVLEMQFASIFGIIIGSLLASFINPISRPFVPKLWKDNVGPSKIKRALGAYIGGLLIEFGARLADGYSSGIGLAGGIKLATSSWLFAITVFISGIISARLIYRKVK